MKIKLFTSLALALLATLNHPLSTIRAQGAAFTYQGRLTSGADVRGRKLEEKLEQKETEITKLKQRLDALGKIIRNLKSN